MPFERSLEIKRLQDRVLRLIRTRLYSTSMQAEEVGVSIPIISRCVMALGVRGHDIRAEGHPEAEADDEWWGDASTVSRTLRDFLLIPHDAIDESTTLAGLAATYIYQLPKRCEVI